MPNKPNSEGGVDTDTHHLLLIKEVPYSFDLLREELQHHPDICEYVAQGDSFPECMARLALKLDIALDGIYEIGPLSEVLLEALRNKRMHPESPHLRARELIDVEMIETAGELTLKERDRNVVDIAPEGAIFTDTSRQRLSNTVRDMELGAGASQLSGSSVESDGSDGEGISR